MTVMMIMIWYDDDGAQDDGYTIMYDINDIYYLFYIYISHSWRRDEVYLLC